ncbi:MAG: MFS transporter [Bacteroides sp.]|nr:MFS transporter [Bacteroides sp.]
MDNSWKKTFGIIWTGQFFSILTSSLVNFALIIWLSLKTGSAEILAWASIAALLPQAIVGPFTGVLIDRWDRKLVMMLADSFIALCTLLLAMLFWLGMAQMWHIFLMLSLRSIGAAFHMPAMQASVPLLAPAEQLTQIAGINQIISSVSQIAGPALGAMSIAIWKIEYVLLFDVAGALIVVSSLLFVTIPNPEKKIEKSRNILREMKEGVMTILRQRGLSLIFLFAILFTFFLMPVSVLFPLMTFRYFGGTELQAGIIEAVWSVGALLGGTIMGARVYTINKVWLLNWMYLASGVTILLSGLLPANGYYWFALLTALGGVSGAVYNSAFIGIVQTKVDPAALGRVFSIFATFSIIPAMLGLIGIGFFADGLGLTTSFIACGAIILIIGVVAFFTPSALQADKH